MLNMEVNGTTIQIELIPGSASQALEELLRNVRATGYDGPCSVEVMDPNVLALPAEDAIRHAAETMKPLLARVER